MYVAGADRAKVDFAVDVSRREHAAALAKNSLDFRDRHALRAFGSISIVPIELHGRVYTNACAKSTMAENEGFAKWRPPNREYGDTPANTELGLREPASRRRPLPRAQRPPLG